MAVIALLCFLPQLPEPLTCYQIEVNTVYGWKREFQNTRYVEVPKPKFTQVIVWRYSKQLKSRVVLLWAMQDQVKVSPPTVTLHDKTFTCPYWIETHTFNDPEVDNRILVAPERR